MDDHSLSATKLRVGLGYGDAALGDMQLIRCLEHELALRDDRLAALEARLNELEAR